MCHIITNKKSLPLLLSSFSSSFSFFFHFVPHCLIFHFFPGTIPPLAIVVCKIYTPGFMERIFWLIYEIDLCLRISIIEEKTSKLCRGIKKKPSRFRSQRQDEENTWVAGGTEGDTGRYRVSESVTSLITRSSRGRLVGRFDFS